MSQRFIIRTSLYGIFGLAIAFMAVSTVYVFLEVLSIRNMIASAAAGTLALDGSQYVAERILKVLIGISVAATLLVAWLATILRTRVARPLGTITTALTRLAKGDSVHHIPEVGRGDETGKLALAFEVFRQNAASLKAAHKSVQEAQRRALALARHDTLTGLPNRRILAEEIGRAIVRVNRAKAAFVLFVVDLDRFKRVKDLHGHAAGDSVLREVTQRIKALVRRTDTFARLGDDKFAIVCETGISSGPKDAPRLAHRIIAAVREPILVGSTQVEVSATVGIAQCPSDGMGAEMLLNAADIAIYRAKQKGRGTYRFYEPAMGVEMQARAVMETDLRSAVASGRIVPHYQPIIDLATGDLVGFEVLARWQRRNGDWVPPDVFIPLAEEMSLISDLTFAVLRKACRDAREWGPGVRLAVNISPYQLKDRLLPAQIISILAETDFPVSRLTIEIVENALIADLVATKLVLASLRSAGVKIALDDFGTGYSSIYHLRELNFDQIKIDRSFVQSMRSDQEACKLVFAILNLIRSLGFPAVAEGIEDTETTALLLDYGCQFGQGFYFGKAMPSTEAAQLIQEDASPDRSLLSIAS